MMLDLWKNQTDIKTFEPESETEPTTNLPKTIKRRHSIDYMMKFLTHRNALFMIPEVPSIEDHNTSKSFTAGTTPTKPRTRKSKKKKSVVHSPLTKALRFVDSVGKTSSTTKKLNAPEHSSQNSVTTCSTASLTDEDTSLSSKGNFEQREVREGKREAACLWETPLLRGNRRWCEQNRCFGDEHYLYAKVRRQGRDIPPVCPVRK